MSFRFKTSTSATLASCILMLALGACGDDSGDDDGDRGDGGTTTQDGGRDSGTGMDGSVQVRDGSTDSSTSSDSSTTNRDSSTATDTGTADSGSTQIEELNGCKASDYVDLSAMSTPTIAFGVGGNVYTPKCATISAGQAVVFAGNFQAHPLEPGTPADDEAGSPNNPIEVTTSGATKSFTFTAAGTYPYYCEVHEPAMVGAIHVK